MKYINKIHNNIKLYVNIISMLKLILYIQFICFLPLSVFAAKVTDFIPKDSVFYFQLNDLDEVYNEIKMSDYWKTTYEQLLDESDMQYLQDRLFMVQNAIGTDLFTVIETVGYQFGFAMWFDETGKQQGGIVIHSGGNLAELKRFTKIVTGFIGMSEGRLTLDAGKHRKVKYDTLEMANLFLAYGFVGDFLVVGLQDNSFEMMIDTYRKNSDSIRRNESYVKSIKSLETGQMNLYVDLDLYLPYLVEHEGLDEKSREQMEDISNVSAVLNLLERGPILQLHVKFDLENSASPLSRFLKEGEELSTLKSLSGDEDLFITFAPGLTETVWELISDEFENSETDDAYELITFLEGVLNLNFEEDVVAGLTGEIAFSVDDLKQFEPDVINNLDLELFDTFQIDAANVSTHGCFIFNSKNKKKWEQIVNSLSNLQNTSVSKTDYNDTNITVFDSNIYYAEKDGFSLLSFSEDQMLSIIDGLDNKKKLSIIKMLPKKPLAVLKLDMLKLLEVASEGEIKVNDDEVEISPLLAWISVKENVAMLQIVVSEKRSPLEELMKLVPFVFSNIN